MDGGCQTTEEGAWGTYQKSKEQGEPQTCIIGLLADDLFQLTTKMRQACTKLPV